MTAPLDARELSWVVLLHQLPAGAAKARVRVWRRLQQLGAIALRGSAYLLPHSAQALEDFEWLRAEIVGLGGTASLIVGKPIDSDVEAEMVERFRELRSEDYGQLRTEIRGMARRTASRAAGKRGDASMAPAVQAVRKRFAKIAAADALGGPLKDEVAGELEALERRVIGHAKAAPSREASETTARLFEARTWVTRPRPGVDRMASAWLIRTFIDPRAQFVFADRPASDQIAFDMFEGDFTHQGHACTFEVLVRRFRVDDAAVGRIAEIVHDLDLKDDRYNAPEGATIGLLVEGTRESHPDDVQALETGMTLFSTLHRAFAAKGGTGLPRSGGRATSRRAARPTAKPPERKPRGR